MKDVVARYEARQAEGDTARPRDQLEILGPVALVDLFLEFGGAAVLEHLFEQADHGLVTPGAGHRIEPDLDEHP